MSLDPQNPSTSLVFICDHRALRLRWEAETVGPWELREGEARRPTASLVYAPETSDPAAYKVRGKIQH